MIIFMMSIVDYKMGGRSGDQSESFTELKEALDQLN